MPQALFVDVLQVCMFLAAAWIGGRLCKGFGLNAAIGELIVGACLGPQLANIAPYSELDAGFTPVFILAGHIGLLFAVMQMTLVVSFKDVWEAGWWSVGVAAVTTVVSVGLCVAISTIAGEDSIVDGVATGAVFIPTSATIALRVLSKHKEVHSEYSHMIVPTSFITNLVALVFLGAMLVASEDDAAAVDYVWPTLANASFVVVGALLSVKVIPFLVEALKTRIREETTLKHHPRDEALLAAMLISLGACCTVGTFIGSSAVGALVAGCMFVYVEGAQSVWSRQMKRMSAWMARLFFAAAVAFTIPLEQLMTWQAAVRGVALLVFGCAVPRILAGFVGGMRDWKVISAGLFPAGKLSFYIAAVCATSTYSRGNSPLLSAESFAAVVWALFVNTIIAPEMFHRALLMRLDDNLRPRSASIARKPHFCIRVEGLHRRNLLPEVIEVLHRLCLEVKEAVIETDDKVDVQVFTVQLESQTHHNGDELDDHKLRQIKHDIMDAIQDPNAQVVCYAAEPVNYNMLEIQVTCSHHAKLLTEITEVLEHIDLQVYMASCQETRDATDVETIYAQNMKHPGTKIGGDKAYAVRQELHMLLENNNVQGEVMVKFPKYSQVPSHFMQEPRAVIDGMEGILKVEVEAESHHPTVLHDVSAQLDDLGLDVVTADVETGDHDIAVFYVRSLDQASDMTAAYIQEALEHTVAQQLVTDCTVRVEPAVTQSTRLRLAQTVAFAAQNSDIFSDDGGSTSSLAGTPAKRRSGLTPKSPMLGPRRGTLRVTPLDKQGASKLQEDGMLRARPAVTVYDDDSSAEEGIPKVQEQKHEPESTSIDTTHLANSLLDTDSTEGGGACLPLEEVLKVMDVVEQRTRQLVESVGQVRQTAAELGLDMMDDQIVSMYNRGSVEILPRVLQEMSISDGLLRRSLDEYGDHPDVIATQNTIVELGNSIINDDAPSLDEFLSWLDVFIEALERNLVSSIRRAQEVVLDFDTLEERIAQATMESAAEYQAEAFATMGLTKQAFQDFLEEFKEHPIVKRKLKEMNARHSALITAALKNVGQSTETSPTSGEEVQIVFN